MSPNSYLIAAIPALIALLMPNSKENEVITTLMFITAFMILVSSATAYWFKQKKPVAIVAKVFGVLNLLFLCTIAFVTVITQSITLDNIFSVATAVSAMYYVAGTHFIEVYTEK